MEHSFAINNYTAESYVLGELNEAERDAYEEHFFSCPVCAEEIKSATEFIETARQVVQNELKAEIYSHAARRSVWGSWLKNWRSMLQPFPAAACLLLIAVSGFTVYQNSISIPQLSQMASIQVISGPLVLHNARDAVPVLTAGRSHAFSLQFSFLPERYSSYDISVLNESTHGKTALKSITPEEAKGVIEILVPGSTLQPGRYAVLVEGVDGNSKGEVDRFTFELKFRD